MVVCLAKANISSCSRERREAEMAVEWLAMCRLEMTHGSCVIGVNGRQMCLCGHRALSILVLGSASDFRRRGPMQPDCRPSLSVYRSAGHDGPASSSNRETVQPLLWSLRAHGSVFCLSIWQSVNSSSLSLSLSLSACACVRMCVMVCMETGQYSFHCFVYVCTLARACCCSFQRNFSSLKGHVP